MKFARYLQDTQTPEWKRAYIDYRALKVQLGLIRAQALSQGTRSNFLGTSKPDQSHNSGPGNQERRSEPEEVARQSHGNTTSAHIGSPWASLPGSVANAGQVAASPTRRRTSNQGRPSPSLALTSLPPRVTITPSTAPSQQTPPAMRTPGPTPSFTLFRDSLFRDSVVSSTQLPLHAILFNLPPTHKRFFDMLDAELEKVESFYIEREKEMRTRADKLRVQFDELGKHRQMFYRSSARAKTKKWAKKMRRSVPPALPNAVGWLQGSNVDDAKSNPLHPVVASPPMVASESGHGRLRGIVDSSTDDLGTTVECAGRRSSDDRLVRSDTTKEENSEKDDAGIPPRSDADTRAPLRHSDSFLADNPTLDPHEYQRAKRRLRRAVIEHYRGLEVLSNYRILNLTGFRKALKKYEKITKNAILDAYIREKVEPSAFADGAIMLNTMLKETEDLFAMRFERGDRKKAIARLRVGPSKTHHFSAFRSGMWLGLALPAISGGIYLSFQEDVRQSLPLWNILLYIYSILFLPVLLSLLIGINIAVWAREKINYVFIFDLNPRSRLDDHEYFELSSFFLCTLAFTFWFSMAQLGSPLLWPLVWIALVLMIMLNPLRWFMWGSARWWIIRTTAKLGASGLWKVEFADFWLGDQFCSLHYSLSNLFFVGCFYTRFYVPMVAQTNVEESSPASTYQSPYPQEAWSTCGVVQNWGWYYALGVLPFMVRFVQSLRRYRDSMLPTHLINAGKYGMGMIYYFFYFNWRHREDPHEGVSYVLWCFTASSYAIYGCAWDFLMDWSLCKPHAQYPLLRPELIFSTQISSYYVALITNLCIRFMWLVYVPPAGPTGLANMAVRSFIAGVLEILRRVQWNFYRLENEHLGNMDQYRVTREVPLPYSFEVHSNGDENEQEEDEDEDGDNDEDGNEDEQVQEQQEEHGAAVPWWKVWTAAARLHSAGHG